MELTEAEFITAFNSEETTTNVCSEQMDVTQARGLGSILIFPDFSP